MVDRKKEMTRHVQRLGREHVTEPSMVGKSYLTLDSETPLVSKVKSEFLARSFLHLGNS